MTKSKQFATLLLLMISLLSAVSFLTYKNMQDTFEQEEIVKGSERTAIEQLNRSIYRNLEREAQVKVDRLAREIREKLLFEYGDNLEQFKIDYDNPSEDTVLITVIDEVIHHSDNRFFHIENDANDMFATSMHGVILDKSGDCSALGDNRKFENEIPMHFNPYLAEQAIDGLRSGETGLFWQFPTHEDSVLELDRMMIDVALRLSPERLRDYEFLVAGYIDRYNDLLGQKDVSATGFRQDNRKVIIVQGFNLYDHIQEEHWESYLKIRKDAEVQLAAIKESRKRVEIEGFLLFIISLVCMMSVYVMQLKTGVEDDEKQ